MTRDELIANFSGGRYATDLGGIFMVNEQDSKPQSIVRNCTIVETYIVKLFINYVEKTRDKK